MNNIFNTTFEISLRVLLILAENIDNIQTVDRIATSDFITVYGKDFGISEENLHGDNNYKFSEYAIRRELVHKAIKLLVIDGFIDLSQSEDGFSYSINQKGLEYCARFDSDYANTYRILTRRTNKYVKSKSEQNILKMINRHSVSSLQRSEISE